jgi:hypothetical protein
MTLRRQERNGCRPVVLGWFVLLGAIGVLVPGATCHAQATTERVVVNRLTGLAIDGFDPVNYFVDHQPQPGRETLETVHNRAIWRFRNEGNQAAFRRNPEIYEPQFGGYDAVAVARGIAVEGRPFFWILAGQRLFLFSSVASRDAFAANNDKILRAARQHWPRLQANLSE